eukprot:gene9921-259_t
MDRLGDVRGWALFQEALNRYTEAIVVAAAGSKRAKYLVDDDHWLRTEWAPKMAEAGHMSQADLCRAMRWKLARGKWRPRLEDLAASNPPADVEALSRQAFAFVDKASIGVASIGVRKAALLKAVAELSKLKGVGPATATLAANRPHGHFSAGWNRPELGPRNPKIPDTPG